MMTMPSQAVLRVVLDTNVLVRLVLGRSGTAEILRQARDIGRLILFLSPRIIAELERVCRYSRIIRAYGLAEDRLNTFLAAMQETAVITEDLYDVDILQTDVRTTSFWLARWSAMPITL